MAVLLYVQGFFSLLCGIQLWNDRMSRHFWPSTVVLLANLVIGALLQVGVSAERVRLTREEVHVIVVQVIGEAAVNVPANL